ncbi:MAG TPA: hypothetical protein VFR43_06765 [Gaiellaceae bacterium]|nr:hypothetical protein [Gaiellaceae bacterium]
MVWETIFMLLVLKIPLVYLCAVVWWAIRAEPLPEEPATLVEAGDPLRPAPPRLWRRRSRLPVRPPWAGPARRPSGGRAASARAEARR